MPWDKFVLSMASLRMVSGSLELLAAVLMLRFNNPEKALLVNSMLALVGPMVLIATTTIGLIGIADKLSWGKFVWIGFGVMCLLIGILKK
ncbi:YqhV family protein [Paenibacillus aquistagni]|uniref:YqhV family protein n=1 Tax=Paenibacillus aquistagni TaxID=1852522 RepID=UPI00145C0EC0|nr:YqhV family protein [Paenibacillus aquistagni]NMM54484.1 YqhV family protein [Paenibacillus aquistagni]